jgi:sugar phosphate isomerase/epimerase
VTTTYAVSTALVAALPLEEALALIGEASFREVEISGDEAWLFDLPRLQAVLDANSLTARSLHTPPAGWDNASPDEALLRASLAVGHSAIEHAAALGAEIVICHGNKPSESSMPGASFTADTFAASYARSRASLEELAEHAARVGVKLALENLPARGAPRPTARMSEVISLIAGLGDHVGICLDVGHSNANGYSAADDAREARDQLLCLHIQDNDGGGEDLHWLPGQGTIDWDAFLDALDEIRFAGMRTFEAMRGLDAADMLEALANLSRRWQMRQR